MASKFAARSGAALFTAVLVALVFFFWWFL
jgi:hypothetical protein